MHRFLFVEVVVSERSSSVLNAALPIGLWPDSVASVVNQSLMKQWRRVRISVCYLEEVDSHSYSLESHGAAGVQQMLHYKGFFLVATEKSVLVYEIHELGRPLKIVLQLDSGSILGVTPVATATDDGFIVTTTRAILQVSLIDLADAPRQHCKITDNSRRINLPAVVSGDKFYWLEFDESQDRTWLKQLPDSTVASCDGLIYSVLALSNDRLLLTGAKRFFFTTP